MRKARDVITSLPWDLGRQGTEKAHSTIFCGGGNDTELGDGHMGLRFTVNQIYTPQDILFPHNKCIRAGDVAELVECLPSRNEGLG